MKVSVQHAGRLASPNSAAGDLRSLQKLRVAIVHYWFVAHRGGERVVEAMAGMFPQADLFSLVADPEAMPESLRGRSLKTSFLQKFPGSRRWHRHFLLLYPLALEQFDLSDYDLVLSSESGPAKGVLTRAETFHVCYCHSPMRYSGIFIIATGTERRSAAGRGHSSRLPATICGCRIAASADRVDYFVANSETLLRGSAALSTGCNGRLPARERRCRICRRQNRGLFLAVRHLVDYERIDLAVAACNRLGRRLHVVGNGGQYARLRKLAGPSIHFCGPLSDKELGERYARCRALLFPGEEDFGIVPVEALSFGRPVIAYERGGVLETVKGFRRGSEDVPEHSTGVFFREQSVDALVEAIRIFEGVAHRFRPFFIKQQADRFAPEHFRDRFGVFLARRWEGFGVGSIDT